MLYPRSDQDPELTFELKFKKVGLDFK